MRKIITAAFTAAFIFTSALTCALTPFSSLAEAADAGVEDALLQSINNTQDWRELGDIITNNADTAGLDLSAYNSLPDTARTNVLRRLAGISFGSLDELRAVFDKTVRDVSATHSSSGGSGGGGGGAPVIVPQLLVFGADGTNITSADGLCAGDHRMTVNISELNGASISSDIYFAVKTDEKLYAFGVGTACTDGDAAEFSFTLPAGADGTNTVLEAYCWDGMLSPQAKKTVFCGQKEDIVTGRITDNSRNNLQLDTNCVLFSIDGTDGTQTSGHEITAEYKSHEQYEKMFEFSKAVIETDENGNRTISHIQPQNSDTLRSFDCRDVTGYDDSSAYVTKIYSDIYESDISENAALYINGVAVGSLDSKSAQAYIRYNPSGTITLVDSSDNGSDGVYDYVFITYFAQGIFGEIKKYEDHTKIYWNDLSTSIHTYRIYDASSDKYRFIKDGEPIALGDIAQGDVISIAYDVTDRNSDPVYDIYVSGDGGTAVLTQTDYSHLAARYTLDGTEYAFSPIYTYDEPELQTGKTYSFLLNAFGDIADIEEYLGEERIGAVRSAYTDTDGTPKVEMIEPDGVVRTYSIESSYNYFKWMRRSFSNVATSPGEYCSGAGELSSLIRVYTQLDGCITYMEEQVSRWCEEGTYVPRLSDLAGFHISDDTVILDVSGNSAEDIAAMRWEDIQTLHISDLDKNILYTAAGGGRTDDVYKLVIITAKEPAQTMPVFEDNSKFAVVYEPEADGFIKLYTADSLSPVAFKVNGTYTCDKFVSGTRGTAVTSTEPVAQLHTGDVISYTPAPDGSAADIKLLFCAPDDDYGTFLKKTTQISYPFSENELIPDNVFQPEEWLNTDIYKQDGAPTIVFGPLKYYASPVQTIEAGRIKRDDEGFYISDSIFGNGEYRAAMDINVYVYDYYKAPGQRLSRGYINDFLRPHLSYRRKDESKYIYADEDGVNEDTDVYFIVAKVTNDFMITDVLFIRGCCYY